MLLIVDRALFEQKKMYCQKDNFLSKIKPKYFQVYLKQRIGFPRGVRLREDILKGPQDLEKWKTSDFSCLITRPHCSRRDKIIL